MKKYEISQEDLQIIINYENEQDLIDTMKEIIGDLIYCGALFYKNTNIMLDVLKENINYGSNVSFYNSNYTVIDEEIEQLGNIRNEMYYYESKNDEGEYLFDLYAWNRDSGKSGKAYFMDDLSHIKVIEENSDGTDDKVMDYETFIKNYAYFLGCKIERVDVVDMKI